MTQQQTKLYLGIYESLLVEAYECLLNREAQNGGHRRRWQDGEIKRLERCLNLSLD